MQPSSKINKSACGIYIVLRLYKTYGDLLPVTLVTNPPLYRSELYDRSKSYPITYIVRKPISAGLRNRDAMRDARTHPGAARPPPAPREIEYSATPSAVYLRAAIGVRGARAHRTQ